MAKPVALIEQGEIKGLAGTTDGDYLRWNSTTSAWESQAGSGGGGVSSVTASAPLASSGGGTPNITLSAGSNAQVLISNGSAYSSQTVSGDATITNAGAVTVTGLQGYDVSNAAPANNQLLVWNSASSSWVPGGSAQGGSGGGGILLYLNNQTTGESPTTGLTNAKQVGPIATDTTNTLTSGTLSQVSYDLIATFVTDVDYPGITDIPAGLWDFNFWASSTGTVTNQTIVQIQVYKYNGTTATLLATSDDIYIYDPTVTAQYIGNVTFANETILATDRIVIELRAKATQNNKTITFSFGGSTPAHLHTTIPSVSGTGLVKVVNGVFQTPASTLVDADVASNADIAVAKLANGTSGQILVAGASDLAYQTMSGDATMASTGALTLASSGVSANTYGSASSVPVTTVDAKGRVTGVTDTSIAISASQVTSGTLSVARGGTGASTLTDRAVLVGNGTDAITSVGPLTDGQLIIGSTGGDPVAASLTGTANQITVTNATGQITLSTPQNIATTSSPTFAGISIGTSGSGTTTIGNTTSGGAVSVVASNGQSIAIGGASTQTVSVGTTGTGAVTIGNSGATTALAGSTVGVTSAAVSVNPTGTGTTTIGNTTNGGNVSLSTALGSTLTFTPGALTSTIVAQTTAATAGGAISMTAGTGNTSGAGGALNATGGTGGATGTGGAVAILGGTGGSTSGAGGAVSLSSGSANGGGNSGAVTVQSGNGVGATGIAGTVSVLGGNGTNASSESTGNISIRAGYNANTSFVSGTVTIQGGYDSGAATNVAPGYVRISGGDTSFTANAQTAGQVVIRGGNNTATGTTGSNGGVVSVTGGSGRLGGGITIRHGANTATPSAGTTNCVLIAGSATGSYQPSGAVQIEGGQSTSSCDIQIGRARTDAVRMGTASTSIIGSFTGIPSISTGPFAVPSSSDQVVTAGANFAPASSYLRITSAGTLSVSGNIDGTFHDGTLLIIRNVNTSAFTITIPSTGNIRTVANGAKALAVGGCILLQYDANNSAWYEIATALSAS
jgi:hypothetical protein